MIDEMYDRAWVEHRQRFSRDMRALFRKAGGALRLVRKPGLPSGDRAFDIPTAAPEEEERVGPDARVSAVEPG